MDGSKLSKKENDFQKLNKQSTMLYLHHHNNQQSIVSQNTTAGVLTHSLVANNTEKYSIGSGSTAGNSNSFCLNKASGVYQQQQHNENYPQHSSRGGSQSHNMSYSQHQMGGGNGHHEFDGRPTPSMNSFLHGHGTSSATNLPQLNNLNSQHAGNANSEYNNFHLAQQPGAPFGGGQ